MANTRLAKIMTMEGASSPAFVALLALYDEAQSLADVQADSDAANADLQTAIEGSLRRKAKST